MNTKAVRTEEDIEKTFDTYADMIYSLSFIMLRNKRTKKKNYILV